MLTGFWRKSRTGFRWFRRTLMLAAVVLICALVWLDRIGVPDFLQQRLVENLRDRGVELEFSRLRFSLVHGLIADNVRVGHSAAAGADSPSLTAAEVRLEMDDAVVLHGKLQIAGLTLREGKFILSLSPTNVLKLDDIQTELHFQADDTWSLDSFKAGFAGAKLALSGQIAHAPEIRNWEIFRGANAGAGMGGSTGGGEARAQLQKFSEILRNIHFPGVPQLSLAVNGDARNIHTFVVNLTVNAPGVRTPWANARNIQIAARLTAPADAPTNCDASWSWWTNLQPYRLAWTARLVQLKSDKLDADSIACGGSWRAPVLALTNLSIQLGGGGGLEARFGLNVATREFEFTNFSHFDPHVVASLLNDQARARLADLSWTRPPSLSVGGLLTLPAWTNRQPDWRHEMQPTLRLVGTLVFTNGTVFGAAIDSLAVQFVYSNLVWRLPDAAIAQSRTRLEISGMADEATKDYEWRVSGAFDPAALRLFITDSNALHGMGLVKFTEPVHLDVDLRGRLHDLAGISATGRVALTNFAVRGQSFDNVAGDFYYTNRVVAVSNARLWRGKETMTADGVTLDFNRMMISFRNGYSTADPVVVTRAIGPQTAALMEPYHFLKAPEAFVEGRVPLGDVKGGHDVDSADMRFNIVGGVPFECLNVHADRLTGTIHWTGQTLTLTNLVADLYGGSGTGSANFDFSVPYDGAGYQCAVMVTNINLHALFTNLSAATNRLEGSLSGQLVVTHGETRDWRIMNGYGQARLRDGLIWDIRLFAILSPVLNAFSPGLGNSRATDAAGAFTITNGVIHSDLLDIKTGTTKLQYSGTVDLRGNLNARVTAQLLRNLWGVGPLISTLFAPVTKVFEYKVTGTLENPKEEPLYVPKLLLLPLHPIRTLEELLPGSNAASSPTNAPPTK